MSNHLVHRQAATTLWRVALTALAIGLASVVHAQQTGSTDDRVMISCGNFSLATNGYTLSGDCNAWTSTYEDISDRSTEVRTFTEKKTGVSINLQEQMLVKLEKKADGNWTVVWDQNNTQQGNYSDYCDSEALTVVTSTTSPSTMTLSATCELTPPSDAAPALPVTPVTADISIEISQFLVNGNGQISWKN